VCSSRTEGYFAGKLAKCGYPGRLRNGDAPYLRSIRDYVIVPVLMTFRSSDYPRRILSLNDAWLLPLFALTDRSKPYLFSQESVC
jgi:hypothetical protein